MSNNTSPSAARFQAVSDARQRKVRQVELPRDQSGRPLPVSEYFGCNTFNLSVMEQKLPREAFRTLLRTIRKGETLDMALADTVAHAMKEWGLERGATHFCHWFQPMTGLTAEKHDAFLSLGENGSPIDRFNGSQLIQGEPDASSFPSGGMRTTFEARGYTAWDPSSPAFLFDGVNGKTLCIPSVFISYHGEALDKKAPLLRSMECLSTQARSVLQLFGQDQVGRVVPTVGPEQEYFLIDRALYSLRPDLILSGRTVLGAMPPKGQQLEDHYFGSIKERILAFMQELELELYKLGFPAKTRHNEVAPSQYEIAPIFEDANVAADHNQLLMEMMRRVAARHDLALLFHEKPFAGVNGNGKHLNWSLMTDQGQNLLEPGETPQENLQFLVFLLATIRAVHRRGGLLRSSIAGSGNDHRLGANEAPPAIMSVFLGEQLTRILDSIEDESGAQESTEKRILSLGISRLPEVSRDNTDRNRTSPFAFTGNKFEFRAVGGSMSISSPITFLNVAVAESLEDMGSAIRQKLNDGAPLESSVMEVVRQVIAETRVIRFEGNNYTQDWIEEAGKRGLPNDPNTPAALRWMVSPDERELLSRYGVLTPEEAEARYHVKLERYVKDIGIEVETLCDLARTVILPAAWSYQGEMASAVTAFSRAVESLPPGSKELTTLTAQVRQVCAVAERITLLERRITDLQRQLEKVSFEEALPVQAQQIAETIVPAVQELRETCDWFETHLPDSSFGLPKYREMLFVN